MVRTEKDERRHICVDAASHERPMLHEVICQRGDCWEQGQGQRCRRHVPRQLQRGWEKMKRGTKGEGKMNVCRMGIDLTGFRGRWRQCVLLSNFKLVNYLLKMHEMARDCRTCSAPH